jgi:hypothetical protein
MDASAAIPPAAKWGRLWTEGSVFVLDVYPLLPSINKLTRIDGGGRGGRNNEESQPTP